MKKAIEHSWTNKTKVAGVSPCLVFATLMVIGVVGNKIRSRLLVHFFILKLRFFNLVGIIVG